MEVVTLSQASLLCQLLSALATLFLVSYNTSVIYGELVLWWAIRGLSRTFPDVRFPENRLAGSPLSLPTRVAWISQRCNCFDLCFLLNLASRKGDAESTG